MGNRMSPVMEERKQRVLETWVNHPNSTFEEIAALAKISDKTFYRYRKEPEFMEKYHSMCEERFKSLEAKAIQKLEEQLDSGNFNAVKYTLDSLGYKPTDKVEASVDSQIDVNIVIDE